MSVPKSGFPASPAADPLTRASAASAALAAAWPRLLARAFWLGAFASVTFAAAPVLRKRRIGVCSKLQSQAAKRVDIQSKPLGKGHDMWVCAEALQSHTKHVSPQLPRNRACFRSRALAKLPHVCLKPLNACSIRQSCCHLDGLQCGKVSSTFQIRFVATGNQVNHACTWSCSMPHASNRPLPRNPRSPPLAETSHK